MSLPVAHLQAASPSRRKKNVRIAVRVATNTSPGGIAANAITASSAPLETCETRSESHASDPLAAWSTFDEPAFACATTWLMSFVSETIVRMRMTVIPAIRPTVAASAATVGPAPRRRRAAADGASVAARTAARTTARTGLESWIARRTAPARRATPTSRPRLHCASRSSQPGTTGPLDDLVGSRGWKTASAVPVIR